MKKIMYYPLWEIDKLEKNLNRFELDGWRLNGVRFSCIFEFSKGQPKNTDYIVTYNMPKDGTQCMYQYEQELLSNHKAIKIQSKHTGYSIFRITGKNRNFDFLRIYRKKYFKHVLFQYMLISLFFLIINTSICFTAFIQNDCLVVKIIFGICTFIMLIVFLYFLFGYIKQTR